MYCDACGAPLSAGQNFCPSCGKSVKAAAAVPPFAPTPAAPMFAPQSPRVASNIRPLGILWLVYSGIHLLPALFLIFFFHPGNPLFGDSSDIPLFVPMMMHAVGLFISLGAILGLMAGWGLLAWKGWARMLAIVLAVFNLFAFPLGTAIGIYTLWVLLPAQSEREYRQQSAIAIG